MIPVKTVDMYWKHGFNVLFESLHGVGKTSIIYDLAERHGLKVAYFSCSTLDPYTDLVGVPIPSEDRSELLMVRPRAVDEAQIIMFDELNRADTKVRNAVLEIIQNRSINGEDLPNLRCCWAAINPTDGYDTQELDPALIDRFDVFKSLAPQPSVEYMVGEGILEDLAKAAVDWWNDHDHDRRETYVSPRRLSKMCAAFQATEDKNIIVDTLPPGQSYDLNKLTRWMVAAVNGEEREGATNGINGTANNSIEYTTSYMAANASEVGMYLVDNPDDFSTHEAVASVFHGGAGSKGIGAAKMIDHCLPILGAINPNVLITQVDKWPAPKKSLVRKAFHNYIVDSQNGTIPQELVGFADAIWPRVLPDGVSKP